MPAWSQEKTIVVRADPDFERRKHREVEYEFDGKVYLADPYVRGPYNRLSNVYAVGQPQGALDTAQQAALATTVGNASPGLYQGVATGEWA